MGKLFDSVLRYFENTPQEVLERDWERIKHLNEVGIDVIDYAQHVYGHFFVSVELKNMDLINDVEMVVDLDEKTPDTDDVYFLAA